jgi:hypothetical protein
LQTTRCPKVRLGHFLWRVSEHLTLESNKLRGGSLCESAIPSRGVVWEQPPRLRDADRMVMNALVRVTVNSTEEAILHALLMAETATGQDARTVAAGFYCWGLRKLRPVVGDTPGRICAGAIPTPDSVLHYTYIYCTGKQSVHQSMDLIGTDRLLNSNAPELR